MYAPGGVHAYGYFYSYHGYSENTARWVNPVTVTHPEGTHVQKFKMSQKIQHRQDLFQAATANNYPIILPVGRDM